MKSCPNCGSSMTDETQFCPVCGAYLPSPVTGNRRTSRRSSGLKIILICVAALLVIGIVTGTVLACCSSKARVMKSVDRSREALSTYVDDGSQLEMFQSQVSKWLKRGKYTVSLEMQSAGTSLSAVSNYSRPGKKMEGQLSYVDALSGTGAGLNYFMDSKELQLQLENNPINIYGVNYKKLQKKLEKSLGGKVLPEQYKPLLTVDPFEKTSLRTIINQRARKEYKQFTKTIEIKNLGKRELAFGETQKECRIYQISWDAMAAGRFMSALLNMNIFPKAAAAFNEALPKMEANIKCYLDQDGALVGLDFVYMGSQYVFLLEGQENAWDAITLKVKAMTGETQFYKGETVAQNGTYYMYLETEDTCLFALEYNDTTGEFYVYTQGRGECFRGALTAAKGEACLQISSTLPELEQTSLLVEMTDLQEKPERFSKDYLDLLELSVNEIGQLMLDLDVDFSGYE